MSPMPSDADLVGFTRSMLPRLHSTRWAEEWIRHVVEEVEPQPTLVVGDPKWKSTNQPITTLRFDRGVAPVQIHHVDSLDVYRPDLPTLRSNLRGLVERARDELLQRTLDELLYRDHVYSDQSEDRAYRRLVHTTQRCTGSQATVLWRLAPDQTLLTADYVTGTASGSSLDLLLGSGIAGHVAQARRETNIPDLKELPTKAHPFHPEHPQTIGSKNWRSALFIPLYDRRGPLGVLGAYSPTPKAYPLASVRRARLSAIGIRTLLLRSKAAQAVADDAEKIFRLRAAQNYYRAKLQDVHDAGKSLIVLHGQVMKLPLSETKVADANTIAAELESLARRIQDDVRSTFVSDPAESVRRERVDLLLLLQTLEARFKPVCTQCGIRLKHVYNGIRPGELEVLANRVHLQDVVSNLIDNSIYFLQKDTKGGQPTITLSILAKSNDALLTVEDNGPGIPPDNLKAIFEPGFTTKANDGGGLGLASVIWHLNLHGGTIVAASEWGYSASFTVSLPAL